MIKTLLLIIFITSFYSRLFSQTLYSNSNEFGSRFNPGVSKSGDPKVMFDDVSMPNSLVVSDSITVTKVKVGIRRTPNASATEVKIYYTLRDDTSTIQNTLIKVPPVLLGTVSLPQNGPSLVTTIASVGDSISTLFKLKADTNGVYTGYQTFFIGIGLSDGTNANGIRFASGADVNKDIMWIYNADSTISSYATNFQNGNPPASFYIQVFGRTSEILPVTLSKFVGEKQPGLNLLSWVTETEINNKGFELLRSSDGINFGPIAFIASKAVNGTSSQMLTYTYSDTKPLLGNAFYKLRQVDKDGRSILSNIVSLKGDKSKSIRITSVYPNPAKSTINISVAGSANEKVSIVIADLTGKIFMQRSQKLMADENHLSINVSKLSAGNYIIKAVSETNGATVVSNFVKQ